MTIFLYIGIASSSALGILDARGRIKTKIAKLPITVVIALLFSMGGGSLGRDPVLGTVPAIFSIDSLPQVTIAVLVAFVFWTTSYKICSKKWLQFILAVSDALALATFIHIGTTKAISFNAPTLVAFYSGVATGIGGSFIGKAIVTIISGTPVLKAVKEQIFLNTYRVMAIIGAFLSTLLNTYYNEDDALAILTIYTSTTGIIINESTRRPIIKVAKRYIYASRHCPFILQQLKLDNRELLVYLRLTSHPIAQLGHYYYQARDFKVIVTAPSIVNIPLQYCRILQM